MISKSISEIKETKSRQKKKEGKTCMMQPPNLSISDLKKIMMNVRNYLTLKKQKKNKVDQKVKLKKLKLEESDNKALGNDKKVDLLIYQPCKHQRAMENKKEKKNQSFISKQTIDKNYGIISSNKGWR